MKDKLKKKLEDIGNTTDDNPILRMEVPHKDILTLDDTTRLIEDINHVLTACGNFKHVWVEGLKLKFITNDDKPGELVVIPSGFSALKEFFSDEEEPASVTGYTYVLVSSVPVYKALSKEVSKFTNRLHTICTKRGGTRHRIMEHSFITNLGTRLLLHSGTITKTGVLNVFAGAKLDINFKVTRSVVPVEDRLSDTHKLTVTYANHKLPSFIRNIKHV